MAFVNHGHRFSTSPVRSLLWYSLNQCAELLRVLSVTPKLRPHETPYHSE